MMEVENPSVVVDDDDGMVERNDELGSCAFNEVKFMDGHAVVVFDGNTVERNEETVSEVVVWSTHDF